MIKTIFDAGFSDELYYFFHVIGYLCVLFFNIWFGKKYNMKPWQSIITTFIVYSITYIWIYVQFWIESGFTNWGGNNMVRGYVYIPLIGLLACKILKIKWKTMCDFMAPCVCIAFGVSHFGCIFAGCCSGYPSSWGIYNPGSERILFPIQLFEATAALLIVYIIVCRAKGKKFLSDGKSFPLLLTLYGFSRFLFEFGRNNRKIFLGCSSLSFHALFMGLVGVAMIIYLNKRSSNIIKLNDFDVVDGVTAYSNE